MPFNVGGEIWSGAMSTVSGRNSGICERGLRLHMDSGIKESYPGIKKIEEMQKYSSDLADKISMKDLKTIIKNAGLLN